MAKGEHIYLHESAFLNLGAAILKPYYPGHALPLLTDK